MWCISAAANVEFSHYKMVIVNCFFLVFRLEAGRVQLKTVVI